MSEKGSPEHITMGIVDPSDAEAVADGIAVGWITDYTKLPVDGEAFRALAQLITTALSVAKQQGADEQREKDAMSLEKHRDYFALVDSIEADITRVVCTQRAAAIRSNL